MDNLLEPSGFLEGIGADRADRLASLGIACVGDLLRPVTVAALASAELSLTRFRRWRQAADLLRVDLVTPDLAEVLVADGTESLEELAEHGLRTLELAVARGLEVGRIRERFSLYRLAEIQREAVRLRYTAMVFGRILRLPPTAARNGGTAADPGGRKGPPLSGIRVSAAGRSVRTDEAGRYVLRGIEPGRRSLRIESDARRGTTLVFDAMPASVRFLDMSLGRNSEPRPAPRAEAQLPALNPGDRVMVRSGKLEQLDAEAYLFVNGETARGDRKALVLGQRAVRGGVEARSVTIDESLVPSGTRQGSILRWTGETLELTALNLRRYQEQRLSALLGLEALDIRSRRRVARSGRGRRSRT